MSGPTRATAAGRTTKDVDLAARRISNDPENVRRLIATVLEEQRDDGLIYDSPSAEVIRDGDAAVCASPCLALSTRRASPSTLMLTLEMWCGPTRGP